MSEQTPVFSIISPVYKVEKYLDQCIQSVIGQTFKNFEYILVDDGSPDSSPEICDRYAAEYPFIKVFHKENEGLFATRRFGLSKAKGKWVVNLDSDDWLEPDALSILYSKIEKHSPDCIIYRCVKRNGGDMSPVPVSAEPDEVIKDSLEIRRRIILNSSLNSVCMKAVRRELLGTFDFSDLYYISNGEDLIQTLEILHNCKKFVLISNVLYNYRTNEQSLTRAVTFEHHPEPFRIEPIVLSFLKEEGIFSEKDLTDYRNSIISNIFYELLSISLSRCSFKKKVLWLKSYSEHDFFKTFLTKKDDFGDLSKQKVHVFRLLKNHRYNRLFIYCWYCKVLLLTGLIK